MGWLSAPATAWLSAEPCASRSRLPSGSRSGSPSAAHCGQPSALPSPSPSARASGPPLALASGILSALPSGKASTWLSSSPSSPASASRSGSRSGRVFALLLSGASASLPAEVPKTVRLSTEHGMQNTGGQGTGTRDCRFQIADCGASHSAPSLLIPLLLIWVVPSVGTLGSSVCICGCPFPSATSCGLTRV